MLTEQQKRFALARRASGAGIARELATLAKCFQLACELQMRDVGFDIHIYQIAPCVRGGITISTRGFNEFLDLDDLRLYLEEALAELGKG